MVRAAFSYVHSSPLMSLYRNYVLALLHVHCLLNPRVIPNKIGGGGMQGVVR